MILLFIFLLIILIFYNFKTTWNPIRPEFYPLGEIIIIGHRGAPAIAQGNTVDSFLKSFETDIRGIELDVQLSKDGELVVFHDWSLINISGYPKKIEDLNYSEILDISIENNYQIPLLGEVLQICPYGKVINIEIKSRNYLNNPIVKKVVKMIQQYKIEEFAVVSSFNPFVLQFVKKMIPNLSTAFIFCSEDPTFLFNSPLWIWMCRPDGFHIDIKSANEKIILWARNNNLAILAYTINNSSDLLKAQELKLDGIFTDDPFLKLSSISS